MATDTKALPTRRPGDSPPGGKAKMPFDQKGAVQGDELSLIAAWADAFDASHRGGAHEGHDGHGGHKH